MLNSQQMVFTNMQAIQAQHSLAAGQMRPVQASLSFQLHSNRAHPSGLAKRLRGTLGLSWQQLWLHQTQISAMMRLLWRCQPQILCIGALGSTRHRGLLMLTEAQSQPWTVLSALHIALRRL